MRIFGIFQKKSYSGHSGVKMNQLIRCSLGFEDMTFFPTPLDIHTKFGYKSFKIEYFIE